jgi:hypothetical protein
MHPAMPHSKVTSTYGWNRRSGYAGRRAEAWWYEPARPAAFLVPPRRPHRGAWSTIAIVLGMLGMASLVMARPTSEPQKLSAIAGGADQHSCHTLVGKTVLATNQIDFNLHAAQALQYGCLEFRDGNLTVHHDALFGHITQVVKVGIDQK